MGCERGCDEDWPWRGESESERWVCVGGQHEREEKVGCAEGRTDRLRNAARGGRDKKKDEEKIRKTS